MNKPEIIKILDRSQKGEYCTVKEWDVKRIPKAVREMLNKYELAKTCDQENPVNQDSELAKIIPPTFNVWTTLCSV